LIYYLKDVSFYRGQQVFPNQSEKEDGIYLIVNGEFEVTREVEKKKKASVLILGKHEILGLEQILDSAD